MNNQAEFLSAAMGLVLPYVVNYLRNCKWFTLINQDSHGRVQAVVALLSAITTTLVAIKSGTFDQGTLTGLGQSAWLFAQTIGLSTTVYHWFMKSKTPASPAAPTIAPQA